MSEVLEAPARPALANFVGGEWRPSRVRAAPTRSAGPGARPRSIGEFPASGAEDVNAAVEAAGRRVPGLVGDARCRSGRAILIKAADAIESPRRADRAGHDARDGQAAARGAHARRRAPPQILRYSAGEALPRRAASASSSRRPAASVYTRPPPARRRRR